MSLGVVSSSGTGAVATALPGAIPSEAHVVADKVTAVVGNWRPAYPRITVAAFSRVNMVQICLDYPNLIEMRSEDPYFCSGDLAHINSDKQRLPCLKRLIVKNSEHFNDASLASEMMGLIHNGLEYLELDNCSKVSAAGLRLLARDILQYSGSLSIKDIVVKDDRRVTSFSPSSYEDAIDPKVIFTKACWNLEGNVKNNVNMKKEGRTYVGLSPMANT